MTHPIIKTDNYLLVVDELSDVKDENIGDVFKETKDGITKTYKIIAHLPLNNAPTLEGVPLLPPLENEEYDFAEIFYNICKATIEHFDDWVEAKDYNKSKTKEDFKYTEEDLRDAYNLGLDTSSKLSPNKTYDTLIQSLQQPKYPVSFESEMEVCVFGHKTITNLLVGKYIY